MLAQRHHQVLEAESAISARIIDQRGYKTVETIKELTDLGFASKQARNVPGLLIPLHSTDGGQPLCIYRPDSPRIDEGRKLADGTRKQSVIKYEFPKGNDMRVDCPPASFPHLKDPATPLYITEGQKKADSLASKGLCSIALLGVWNFKGGRGKAWLPDWDHVALNEREVYLVFDSDVMVKEQVAQALRRFTGILYQKGALVTPVLLPDEGDGKTGIDDWFAKGHTLPELDALIAHSKVWFEPVMKVHQRNAPSRAKDYVEELAMMGYGFRSNELDDNIEVNGEPISDNLEAKIRSRMRDKGFGKELGAIKDAYIEAAVDNSYHPVKEYLEALEWDGRGWIQYLAGHFRDHDNVFGIWLRRWLIGAVAKAFEPTQNYMLVLDGGQGLGKSHFAAWLGSALPAYFIEGPIQPENKDFIIRLANKWIWEVSELGSTTKKADREALKAFITTQIVVARKPYGRHDIKKPALASLIGTINDEAGFLNDPTGSRRFLACTLTGVDWNYTKIDVNQVWAEAYAAYKAGETWSLSPDEKIHQRRINEYYESEDPLETSIKAAYMLVEPMPDTWVSTGEVLAKLALDDRNVGYARRVSTLLKKLGCKRTRGQLPNGQRVNGWLGLAQADDNSYIAQQDAPATNGTERTVNYDF